MSKKDVSPLSKSELRKKQDELLQKKKVGLDISMPNLELQSRIVGVNSNVVIGAVLLGSLVFNWRLYKIVDNLNHQVSDLRETKVSVEVTNQGVHDSLAQERYLNHKLSEMKNEIINSIQKREGRSDFEIAPGSMRSPASHSIMPSALELINQIDVEQYTVADAEQFATFRGLLKSLGRMRFKYRKEVQTIVKAYSNTHHISGADRKEYQLLLERRKEAFENIEDLHEQVKEDWKLKNKKMAKM